MWYSCDVIKTVRVTKATRSADTPVQGYTLVTLRVFRGISLQSYGWRCIGLSCKLSKMLHVSVGLLATALHGRNDMCEITISRVL